MRRLWLPVLGLVAGLALPAHAAPDAIVFTLSHADCGPTGQAGDNRFRLFMNGTLLADVPTSVGCVQSNTPLVVTITDPTALAGFDPARCNTFRVDMTRNKASASRSPRWRSPCRAAPVRDGCACSTATR